jgi:hypothetical protein
VRSGVSAASAYGWDELAQHVPTWSLDAYLSMEAFSSVQAQLNQLDLGDDVGATSRERDTVVLRVWSTSRGRFRGSRGDPPTDTRAAAAHMVGVLWAAASRGDGEGAARGDRPVQRTSGSCL